MPLAALLFLQAGTIDLLRDPDFLAIGSAWTSYGTTPAVETGPIASDPNARILRLPITTAPGASAWSIGLG